ncbi:hypothetical protein DESUT3_02450 [Desulfuromonas versatilis]|uniref:Alpha/beta hydrolase n=1 Tax=Desulfuromonas versatilis TaxID=2802975 RepID=A0ABN6DVJ5_9BACT|nr:alpha/beta hydrolase [Desulfuromonas versatilis]BCR03176.1 hypothetical protein DESUT3_02450 [Desulfuromonas versatilis]
MARMILLPGLGADERMFANLGTLEFALETPRLPVPGRGESMPSFAARTAGLLGIGSDDLLGGSSFGSMVASEIARQRQLRGLVLLGGALDSSGLRMLGGLRGFPLKLFPLRLLKPLVRTDKALELVFGPENPQMRALARQMMDAAPDALLLEGGRMAASYFPSGAPRCPVFAIHGGRDRVMAPPPVDGCRILAEAGHGIVYTHGPLVGDFLREAWHACPGA